jgi:DNA-directed RNA polymerase specialized sigma24 family protein
MKIERNTEKRYRVRWQDGTMNPYEDRYKEIHSKQTYTEWMEANQPFGRDEFGNYLESPSANPDVMSDEDADSANQLNAAFESSLSPIEKNARQKAFASLTDKQKEAWILVMQDGRSENEAALVLGVSRTTIMDRLIGAKNKFATVLREYTEKHTDDDL